MENTINQQDEMTFEKALVRLEEIVRALENATAPLNETLKLYEEGVGLVRWCGEELDHAEQRVKILTRDAEKNVVEADFTAAE